MQGQHEGPSPGPWLVKSGDRILGPFSTDKLSVMIREKEVVVIDEIMAPRSRWAYVRDVAVFQKIVEEIRLGLLHQREDTEVQGYTSTTRLDSDAVTPVPTQTKSEPDASPVSSATVTAINTAIHAPSMSSSASSSMSSSAPSSAPSKLAMDPLPHHSPALKETRRETAPSAPERGKMGRRPGLAIGSIILIVAVVFAIYTVLKSSNGNRSTHSSPDQTSTQASVAWKRGEFERALELYRTLDHQQPSQPLVSARLAILMMKLEGQTVEAKRIVESARANAKDDEQKSALEIATGLAALQNDDAKEAITHFSQAGSSWIATFDEGVAQASLKNWSAAQSSFEKAGAQAPALLMLAKTYLNSADGASQKAALRKQADEAVKKALSLGPDFQQEALLMSASIDVSLGNSKHAAKMLLEALETDPNQTSDHFHDPALNLDSLSWSKLLPSCQALDKDLNSKISAAMLGLCLAKANQLEDAMKLTESEVLKDPSNAHLHAVAAYLHTLADRDDAARASLTLSKKAGPSRLAEILSARLCAHERQEACAEENWSKLAAEDHPPIAALTGLAQLREQKGDRAGAGPLLVKAESLSPTYLPLLRLREDASK